MIFKSYKRRRRKKEQFFKLKERGTSVRTEMIAGMTTFFAMVYILMVNANMFANSFGDGSNALVLILGEGIVFMLLTVTGLRKKIFESLPDSVRVAIPGGIGLFIALLGLENAGIVVPNSSTCVDLGSFNLLGLTVDGFYETFRITMMSPFQAFGEFAEFSLFEVLRRGFDFSDYIAQHGSTNLWLTIFTTALAFCMVDMFDTLGTLSDAIATTIGALCGTSTVTTFSEVNAGVAAGGRTGLTSVFCGLFFFIAMFLSPIAQLVPSCTTAAALFIAMLVLTH